ncbi:uncharacterized protein LOC111788613 [Cucurbita pepo subsp. pepo]|uniref:uncharacterized protein LOC111788613 n=1 Tax=Cucurbita pepo subsp. pepo TaxID=3664 RepID=UPI000C9D4D9C|nr:uncharacterized protein LOC111788613 [Cucurbita pepo subsp. pepo]
MKREMKRKWEEPRGGSFNSPADIELHLESPLPLEWQRCLDIQSGKIHFYNTKTRKRTSMDPRSKLETSPGGDPLSLDLELNLNSQSMRNGGESKKKSDGAWKQGHGCPQQEMIARVCMQCHLLVMVLKSSPTCPNCKFIHPIDLQTPPTTTLFIASRSTNNNQTQSLKGFPNPIQNKV